MFLTNSSANYNNLPILPIYLITGYVEEALKDLCDLVGDFVCKLNIRELQVEPRFLGPDGDELVEPADRINLAPVIRGLKNLTQLHIRFSVRDVKSNYRKVLFKFTTQDCRYVLR